MSYAAHGLDRGKFVHEAPGEPPCVIHTPNRYEGLSPRDRTVILKIHGAVSRVDRGRDSFVITEDNYIDYLARTDISNLIPASLRVHMEDSHFLFLGYGLRDWNLRVILHRLRGEDELFSKSWAVQLSPDSLEQEFWKERRVDILDAGLDDYVAELHRRLCEAVGAKAPA